MLEKNSSAVVAHTPVYRWCCLDEHLLKPAIAEPRPSIGYLADAANGGVLEQGVQAFYRMPDKASRSAYLEKRLEASSGLQMPELLREHWVEETGYSFPSGHAFAASALAGWFMFMILCAGRRHWLLPVFWGWVVAVCYSRVLLGVHRPQDVMAGTVEGMALVAVAVLASSGILGWRKKQNQEPL
ncbi:phosphatase PAP2 family protein [Thiolapillus sp.]|uniref:phosphatase PAP2 family protein n=5 Tax=Thiolapillus sp. TaxID=2017437 RepID=UPI0025D9D47A|nr:phosphatase PAP2 family protein [Thiolapillus sp.]